MAELSAGYGKESDNYLLQHAFGNFAQGQQQPSDLVVSALTTFREELHSHINPRNLLLLIQSFMKRSDLMESMRTLW